jgi:TonB family protein
MKKVILWLLLTSVVAVTAAQTGQQGSEAEKATREMCDAAAPKLRESGTNKVVLMMTIDNRGRVESFKTESPKGLRLEKMKEASTAIKAMQFHPAEKDGSPVAVQARITFDCPSQPPSASKNQ